MGERGTPSLETLLDCDDAFAELGAPQPGDDALLNRAIGSTMSAAPTGAVAAASGGLSTSAWLALLAALAGVIAVLVWPGAQPEDVVREPVIEADAELQPEPTPSPQPAVATPEPAAAAAVPQPRAGEPSPLSADSIPATKGSAALPARARKSAAELLELANTARGARRPARALSLYKRLFDEYPKSREARTARVSAGRLHLDQGKPKAALAQFKKYLSAAPRGSLAEEAAAGRAMALGRLGRAKAERDAWTQLLDEHPGSVHSARAKKRISELSED